MPEIDYIPFHFNTYQNVPDHSNPWIDQFKGEFLPPENATQVTPRSPQAARLPLAFTGAHSCEAAKSPKASPEMSW